MSWTRIVAMTRKEVLQIVRDPRSLLIILVIPLVQLLIFGYAVNLDVKHVPLCIYDRDGTQTSQDYLKHFQAIDYFNIVRVIGYRRSNRRPAAQARAKIAGRKASKPAPTKQLQPKTSREKVRAHRARMRKRGFRLVQMWLPNTRTKEFAEQAHSELLAIARSETEADDQAFIELGLVVEFARRGGTGKARTSRTLVAHRSVLQVKRGDIWTVAGGPDYVGKPRPAVVVQRNEFDATPSITVCPLSSTAVENVHARFAITPSELNGLELRSYALVDKLSTIPRSKVGRFIGRLDTKDLSLLNQRIALFLGLGD